MRRLTIIILLAAAAGMVSCSAVRHCQAPDVDLPERIAGEDSDSLTVADVQWWRFYGDSTLCRIIERTLDNNRDMLAAAARVERLRELYRVSRAERLPSVTGTAYGDYETNDYAGEKSSRDPGFGAKVTLSWELDLWGNLRWAKRKGGAEYLASVEDRRAMRMTLVASVAAAYFNLIALDNELSIVRRTLITRSEGLYQVQLRFGGGLTSEMVYQQAKVEYASTAALIPDLERKIKIMENGILLLMGENPDRRVVRGKMNTDAEFADSLPVGLPSGLLQRRPDVRSSEQRLRAAMASAGMAYADRFPRLTFNLTGGLENDALSGFFRSPFSLCRRDARFADLRFRPQAGPLPRRAGGLRRSASGLRAESPDGLQGGRRRCGHLSQRPQNGGLEAESARCGEQIRRTGAPAIPCRKHQLHRRAGRPAALFRRPDRPEQLRARRASGAGAALQGVGRRLDRMTWRYRCGRGA